MKKISFELTEKQLKHFEDFITYNSMVASENASINSDEPDEIEHAKNMNPVFTKIEAAIKKAKE